MRRLINANFGYGDYHLVLTYKKNLRPNPAEARKRVTNFLRTLRWNYKKRGEELKYIITTEYKNKAIHHHLILNGIEANANKIVRDCWKWGSPHFTPLDDTGQYKDLAAYLIKETDKTYKERDGGARQRYSCSRNLIKPVAKITIVKKAEKWLEDGTVWNTYHARPGVEGVRSSGIRRVHFDIDGAPMLDVTEELDLSEAFAQVETCVVVR